jgi:excisionase family DNA binding protein
VPSRESDDLLRPAELAELFGVRTPTIARWAREGKLKAFLTPGGHRRYRRSDIRELLATQADPDLERMTRDAIRMYDQGWSIRQVAERFDCSYGAMRRILQRQIALRNRSGAYPPVE